jgi:hypothetical protein
VSRGASGATVCSSIGVADGGWHHVAVTRSASTRQLAIYVDGQPRGSVLGPTGNVAYRDGRSGPENDPFLVFGAEKHDAGPEYPSYHGWLDEVRISTVVRYSGAFAVPTGPLPVEPTTVALYRFNEGSGTTALDETGNDHGAVLYGGTPAGPVWSTAVPF